MPAREVIVMVEDSQNDGRITLASIHTSQTVLHLKEVSLRCQTQQALNIGDTPFASVGYFRLFGSEFACSLLAA